MGQEIGFNIYEKKPFDEEGKLVRAKNDKGEIIQTSWVCGRTNSTNSWGYYFKDSYKTDTNTIDSVTPVFQKELADKKGIFHEDGDEWKTKFTLMDFKEFKDAVMDSVEEDLTKGRNEQFDFLMRVNKNRKKIADLRELQRNCNCNQAFAFEKWGEEINELEDNIVELEAYYKNFEEEDYDTSHAKCVKKLIEEMEEYLKEDKYYIVPYFSY